jgi:Zn finger protein HypA/HybF involved in hydrogenase expression
MKLPTLTCLRCDKSWVRRKETLPRCCPRCQSPYWQTKKGD